jgi:O-antigen/teichoic acid export membrane protein
MGTVGTKTLREENVNAASIEAEGDRDGWAPAAIAADIATLGTGTILTAVFNLAVVFVVPKLISVEDYAYWKLFGLYGGYAGFIHLGFVDGVLLRWAGKPMNEFHHEIAPAITFLFGLQVALLAPICMLMAVALRAPLLFIGIAVALYTLIFNLMTLLQFSLQSARIFRPVAISAVAAPALFLGFVLVGRLTWHSDYRTVITFDTAGWLAALLLLLWWTRPWSGAGGEASVQRLGLSCVKSGWPIVVANMGVMLIACADRLAASWSAKILDFAQYSLAASAMAVPMMAIPACGNVLFSHLAATTPAGRKRVYGTSARTLLMAWAVLLPYYFCLTLFVQRFLPKYAPSLAYARVLLLGIPFLAVIQILQISYTFLSGLQRPFMVRTALVLAVSLGATSLAAFRTGSLRLVALVEVIVLAAWWLFNEWTLRELTGEGPRAWARFLGFYALAASIYWLTTFWNRGMPVSIFAYYICLGAALVAFCRDDLRLWTRLLLRSQGRFPAGGAA